MKREEKLQIIAEFLGTENIQERAKEALRREFPNAPQAMIDTAVFHVYTDGVDAVLDWLVAAAQAVTSGGSAPDDGLTSHLLYHLFNWHQFRELMLGGSQELLDWVEGLEDGMNEGDTGLIRSHLAGLKDAIEASRSCPRIER